MSRSPLLKIKLPEQRPQDQNAQPEQQPEQQPAQLPLQQPAKHVRRPEEEYIRHEALVQSTLKDQRRGTRNRLLLAIASIAGFTAIMVNSAKPPKPAYEASNDETEPEKKEGKK